MKAVFAFMAGTGAFTTNRTAEWSYSIGITGIRDLCTKLGQNKLQGIVGKLAIVAHGDAGGQVKLERNLTPDSFVSFRADFAELSRFLTPNAKVIFMSCVSGMGPEGTSLLKSISLCVPGRFVIGFEVFGAIAGKFLSNAGQVYETEHGNQFPSLKAMKSLPTLTEASQHAKWAHLGAIIRRPYGERVQDSKHRCGAVNCPGHRVSTDRCPQPYAR